MTTFEEEMAAYQEQWDNTEVRSGGQILPDGDYQARVVESRVEKSDLYDEWQLMFKFWDINGQGSIRCWDNIQQETGMSIAKSRLARLGYDVEERGITGLREACEAGEFIDLICDIKVKTTPGETKDFKNVYVNRCYGKAGDEGVPAGSAGDPDDDIPF